MKPDVGKIMEKTVDHMTQGRYISTDSMKSGDDFTNFGHHCGDGKNIELDKTNPIYLVGSYYSMSGWRYPSQKMSG